MFTRLRERAEFGDALVLLFLLVFARQYLWLLDSYAASNALAWTLSAALAAAAFFFYVRTKPFPSERAGREFWLVVIPPLVFFFLLRLPFPDTSYDVLNYRLLHAERSLRGTLFAAGDFFPTPAPYNPAPDTLTGLFRLALGYRLGAVVNLFALVWAARVADKLLRPSVPKPWARAACVLLSACWPSTFCSRSTTTWLTCSRCLCCWRRRGWACAPKRLRRRRRDAPSTYTRRSCSGWRRGSS